MKKIVKTLLALLLAVTTTINVYIPKAAEGYSLTGKTLISDLFDFTPYNMNSAGAIVAFMHATSPYGTTSAYCIEPHITAHLGDTYVGIDGSDNDEARQVILNYYKKYYNHELWDTTAGYYAAQLAVWGRIEGVSPASLSILSGLSSEETSLANRIQSIAIDLYNDHSSVESSHNILYNGGNASSNYDLTDSDYIYRVNGNWYYRSELMGITTSGLGGNLSFTVNVQNGLVTNSKYYGASTSMNFGEGTDNGTGFYVWVPIDSTNDTIVSISGDYDYYDVMTWRFESGEYGYGQNLMSMNLKNRDFSNSITFNGDVITINAPSTEFTGNIKFAKEATGPISISTSTSSYGTLNTISGGTIREQHAGFAVYKLKDGTTDQWEALSREFYLSDNNGIVNIENIPIEIDAGDSAYTPLIVCEVYIPAGYGKLTDDSGTIIDLVSGNRCNLYTFRRSQADSNNIINKDMIAANKMRKDETKTFSININKVDKNNNPLSGIDFGIYTTEDMTIKNVLGDASQDTILPAGSLVGIMRTNSNGNASFDGSDITHFLPATQNYIIRELNGGNAIKEFTYNGNTYYDEIEIDVLSQTDLSTTYSISVKNYQLSEVTIHKTDTDTGAGLGGVDFELSNENYLYNGTTNNSGLLVLEDVHYGTYTLKEVSTPEGYEPISPITITIDEETETFDIKNKKYPIDTITINKDVQGNTPSDKLFEFNINDGTNDSRVSITGRGSVDKTFTFTAPGTYKYTITEVNKGYNGYTFDTTIYTYTYTVERNTDEKLVITDKQLTKKENGLTEVTSEINFTNIYSPIPVSRQLEITKNLVVDNGVNNENPNFIIEITGNSGSYETLNIGKNQTKNKVFSFSNPGTYRYTVKEKAGSNSEYTYDNKEYTLNFTVVDNDGQLEITSLKDDSGTTVNNLVFENHYSQEYDPVQMTIRINKTVEGISEGDVTDRFRFTIAGPNNFSDTVMIPGVGYKDYVIPEFTAAGVYTYTITENDISSTSWTKDSSTYKIEFTVSDVHGATEGYFNVVAKVFKNNVEVGTFNLNEKPVVTFNNQYHIPDGDYEIGSIKVKKTANVPIKSTERFAVSVNGAEYDLVQDNFIVIPLKVTNVGTHTWTVKEVNTNIANWTYDSAEYTVTAVVSQEGYGVKLDNLTIVDQNGNNVNDVTFNNTYTRPNNIEHFGTVSINKEANITSNESFAYIVTENGVDHENSFKIDDSGHTLDIAIDHAGVSTFIIKEKQLTSLTENEGLEINRWTFDDSTYTLTLETGFDPSTRGLKLISKTMTKNGNIINPDASGNYHITFTNTYGIKNASDTITIEKEVLGTELVDLFNISINDGTSNEIIPISGSGEVNKTLHFNAEGTYTYTIKENNMGYSGYTFDDNIYVITYNVVRDNGQYKINSKRVEKNGTVISNTENIKFVNAKSYSPITKTITVNKKFNLSDDKANNFVSNFSADTLSDFSITGNGSKDITFTFDYSNLGTNVYKIKEIAGSNSHITYDNTVHNITFTVTETATGLEVTSDKDSVLFRNTYSDSYAPVKLNVKVRKEVTGIDPNAVTDKFHFHIGDTNGYDENLEIDGRGYIDVLNIPEITQAGTYKYKIIENNTSNPRWTIDNSVYEIEAIVSDHFDPNGGYFETVINVYKDGTLVDTLDGTETPEITFTNNYSIPDGNYEVGSVKVKKTANVVIKNTENFITDVNGVEYDLKQDNYINVPLKVRNVGTYTWTIKEKNTAIPNWTYDTDVYTAVATVVQDGYDLKLEKLTITNQDGAEVNEVVFNNIYKRPETIQDFGTALISKTANITTNEPFKYVVSTNGVEGAPSEFKANASGNLLILSASKEGVTTFTIKEKILTSLTENEGLDLTSWTFDDSIYEIKLETELDTVSRNLKLKSLTATKDGEEINPSSSGSYKIVFNNEYGLRPTSDVITIEKDLIGTRLEDKFEFIVNDGTKDETLEISGKGTKDKKITFSNSGTYTYTIKEKDMGYSGYEFDKSIYEITYNVVQDNDRFVIQSKTVKKNGVIVDSNDNIKFINTKTYKPVTVKLRVNKQFNLSDSEANNLTSKFNAYKIGDFSIKGNGYVDLPYTFTYDNIGENVYMIKEIPGTDSRITYDNTIYPVVFKVYETTEGLKVEASVTTITFNNTFKYDSIDVVIPVRKELTGDVDNDAKEFTFTVDGQDMIYINGAGFKNYVKTFTDEGNIELSVKEKDMGYKNYTFDKSEYKVNIKVVKEELELKPTITITKDGTATDKIIFTNKYTVPTTPSEPEHDPEDKCRALGSSWYWSPSAQKCYKRIVNTNVK